MGHKNPPHVLIMQKELDKRITENDQYSMRAFAQSLGLDPAYISRVLNNKQAISTTAAKQISRRLDLCEEDRVRFLESVADEKRCTSLKEMDPGLIDCGD
ncbi:helix-turn-helix transcriptional regulator [Planctomycetota bacterium]|nr:helix-turn-helix transcriptional regulator [Planctomycetota bacterium]